MLPEPPAEQSKEDAEVVCDDNKLDIQQSISSPKENTEIVCDENTLDIQQNISPPTARDETRLDIKQNINPSSTPQSSLKNTKKLKRTPKKRKTPSKIKKVEKRAPSKKENFTDLICQTCGLSRFEWQFCGWLGRPHPPPLSIHQLRRSSVLFQEMELQESNQINAINQNHVNSTDHGSQDDISKASCDKHTEDAVGAPNMLEAKNSFSATTALIPLAV